MWLLQTIVFVRTTDVRLVRNIDVSSHISKKQPQSRSSLVGCYAVYIGSLLTFRDSLSVPKSTNVRCVTTQRSKNAYLHRGGRLKSRKSGPFTASDRKLMNILVRLLRSLNSLENSIGRRFVFVRYHVTTIRSVATRLTGSRVRQVTDCRKSERTVSCVWAAVA